MTAGEIARHLNRSTGSERTWWWWAAAAGAGMPGSTRPDSPSRPRPELPTLDTAAVYPGACLIEGTLLSEGRGTTRPFEMMGAPWVDGVRLKDALAEEELPGVRFRPIRFRPTFHKFHDEECGGVMQHVIDRRTYRPWRTGIALLSHIRRLWPAEFAWRPPPYEYETVRLPIDILFGNPELREGIEAGRPPAEIADAGDAEGAAFDPDREAALLYS